MLVERLRSIMVPPLPPRSSLLAELFARTRSEARRVLPPGASAAASLEDIGDSGGSSAERHPPPEPKLALALGEEEVPCSESLLCAIPLQWQ